MCVMWRYGKFSLIIENCIEVWFFDYFFKFCIKLVVKLVGVFIYIYMVYSYYVVNGGMFFFVVYVLYGDVV